MQGAFILVGNNSFGYPLLVVMGIGVFTYASWRFWEGITGQGSDDAFGPYKNFFRYRLSPLVSVSASSCKSSCSGPSVCGFVRMSRLASRASLTLCVRVAAVLIPWTCSMFNGTIYGQAMMHGQHPLIASLHHVPAGPAALYNFIECTMCEVWCVGGRERCTQPTASLSSLSSPGSKTLKMQTARGRFQTHGETVVLANLGE